MTFGNDTARAALSSSGWAAPAGDTSKKSPDKWLFWLLPFCYAVLYAIINWISDEYVQTPPAAADIPQLPQASGPLRWIGYALTPLYVFMKIGFTTVCLALGAAIITWNVRFPVFSMLPLWRRSYGLQPRSHISPGCSFFRIRARFFTPFPP